MKWSVGSFKIERWYDISEKVGPGFDLRPENEVTSEYFDLMKESVRLRFRLDVPVGINLSGGLDSSTLLSLVQETQGDDDTVTAFTFVTGDERYDELPLVERMIRRTKHPLIVCDLTASDVPELAASVQYHQDEPFGGIPTLAYSKIFERANSEGVRVLLDGNGMDEQWGGYDYYSAIDSTDGQQIPVIQGSVDLPVRPECLNDDFRSMASPLESPKVFPDQFRNLQYRDTVHTKIPRALRFNDRISMRSSTELREPFLDHRLVELAMRQPQDRKRISGKGKKLLRQIMHDRLPPSFNEIPKRAFKRRSVSRLRGPLKEWADGCIKSGLDGMGSQWLNRKSVLDQWSSFCVGTGDNSFFVWQWITVGMISG